MFGSINGFYIPSKKSSAQVCVWVNSFLTRNGYIKCYISLFKEIILQQCDAFQTEIQDSLTKPCAFKASRGQSSKMLKLPIRGLLFKFVDFLYSRSELFDRVIKVISSENKFFSLSFDV